jgi:hypothetical protein
MKVENLPIMQTSYLNANSNGNRIIISDLEKLVKIDEEL